MYIETTLVTICSEVEIKVTVISERQVWNLLRSSTGPGIVPYVDVLNTVAKRLCMCRVTFSVTLASPSRALGFILCVACGLLSFVVLLHAARFQFLLKQFVVIEIIQNG